MVYNITLFFFIQYNITLEKIKLSPNFQFNLYVFNFDNFILRFFMIFNRSLCQLEVQLINYMLCQTN